MDEDRRKGDNSLPENLEEILSKAQQQALPGVKCLGWEPRFLRKSVFQSPVLVMRNSKDGSIGVLEEDGRLIVQDDIETREEENDTQAPPSPKNLHYF